MATTLPPARPSASPAPTLLPSSATTAASPLPAPNVSAIPTASSGADPADYIPAILFALIGTAGIVWLVMRHRRKMAEGTAFDFEPPLPLPPSPELADPETPVPSAPVPPPPVQEPLTITLEPLRLTASLMATTLAYRVTVTNSGSRPLTALALEGDMIAAHASLPPERQIAQPTQRLELRHAHVSLAPDESVVFSGDLRVPLNAITPIRAGNAAYFVPLIRWRAEAAEPNGAACINVATFVIGEVPRQSDGALKPFRLDLGPRTYSPLAARPVS